jgi:UDP-glucose:(heptosyl)LPS alpha-1,3-glucosyltransferase
MRPLSLALIRQRYAQDGGAERFVARALEALKSRDMRLTLVTREWAGSKDFADRIDDRMDAGGRATPGAVAGARTAGREGIPIRSAHSSFHTTSPDRGFDVLTCNPFYIGRIWRDWAFARGVCRALRHKQFDLVQSHERIACCDIYRAGDGVHREWLKQRARVLAPPARWAMALNPYHCYVKRAERRLFMSPQLKAVICNSRMVRDEIRHYFGLPEDRLHVIYSGVDLQACHPDLRRHRAALRTQYGIPEAAPLFLFVGSGFERKGVTALLQAVARLPASAHLLVVGRDKHAAKYAAQAQALGLGGRARFVGSQPEVKPYYGAADVLVLPTLYDPFPNVALEAMAAGLPVVTSDKCGAAELIENGRNGFVGDALDVAALADNMRALLLREKSEAMGQAARATVAALHPERMAEQLVRLYQSLMGK